jgi:putative ABC transport system permease protein
MKFALAMAGRELRSSWIRLAFFFLCIALGVAAVVAVRSVIQSLTATLAREGRALIAADLLLESGRPWGPAVRERLLERPPGRPVLERAEGVETATMARAGGEEEGAALLVELRAVGPAFPLYGEVRLEDNAPYSPELLAGGGALVRRELLTRLGVEVGDAIQMGGRSFVIRGVLVKEPGRRLSTFSLGPRVLIDLRDLEKTGLLATGSRVRYQIFLKLEPSRIDPFTRRLKDQLKNDFVTVRSFTENEDQLGRRLARTENYLSLAGFVIMILGGLGVWSVARVFMHQKLRSIAVLKCLGATSRQILTTYLCQMIGLGLAGSLLGVALAAAVLHLVPPGILLDVGSMSYGLTAPAIAQGLGLGVLISFLFSLVPLLGARRVKPLLLLRHEVAGGGERARTALGRGERLRALWSRSARTETLTWVVVGASVLALASWQAGSLRVGAFVLAGFAGVAALLHLAGLTLVRAARPLARSRSFPLRHAVMSLTRPGNQNRVILLAVGLGCFFILTIHSLEANLQEQFALELSEDAPDLFLLDIQQDQAEPVAELARSLGASQIHLAPVLRARVVAVEGREVRLSSYEEVRKLGSLGREYTITYRDYLEANERVVEGRFWDRTASGEPEVSIEQSLRDRFGIQVGDTVRFDILGRLVAARVSSVRNVEWSEARNGGFMFLFRPGALEAAPHTYVGFLRAPGQPEARARFQRDVVARFPNLSIIDLHDVLATIAELAEKISLGISLVGGMALLTGGLTLIGSLAMTRFERLYETAIYRTLGAGKRMVAAMMLLEYGGLGVLAGVAGSAGSLAMSWAASRHLLEIPWNADWAPLAAGVALAALAAGLVGVTTALDVVRHKPLAILRAE